MFYNKVSNVFEIKLNKNEKKSVLSHFLHSELLDILKQVVEFSQLLDYQQSDIPRL